MKKINQTILSKSSMLKSIQMSKAIRTLMMCAVVVLGVIETVAAQEESAVDRVLVIINDDVITQSEFDYRRTAITSDLKAGGQEIPAELHEQLLESMISERMQVQEAQRRGIEVSDAELEQALTRYAQQQNFSLNELKVNVERSGQPFKFFSESVRDSITISRFSEYYARSRVVVPDYEIDGWLATNVSDKDGTEYEIAQILIKGNEEKRESAETVRDEISRGMNFEQAVARYSEAADAQQGGLIGWRKPEQLPAIFVAGVKDLEVGGVSEIIRSPNGFHILKLVDVKGERSEILQSNVRHILISASSNVAKSQAKKKAAQLSQRIADGEDFEALARIYSDDSGSAALGGGLGWVSPGQMVPEFEKTYTEMSIGKVSKPFESTYGVHILRVEDRRKKNVTEQIKRGRAENFLRRQRADREFGQWVRELMEGAYIHHVAKPV